MSPLLLNPNPNFAVRRWRRVLRIRPLWRNRDRGNCPHHSARVGSLRSLVCNRYFPGTVGMYDRDQTGADAPKRSPGSFTRGDRRMPQRRNGFCSRRLRWLGRQDATRITDESIDNGEDRPDSCSAILALLSPIECRSTKPPCIQDFPGQAGQLHQSSFTAVVPEDDTNPFAAATGHVVCSMELRFHRCKSVLDQPADPSAAHRSKIESARLSGQFLVGPFNQS